MSASAMKGIMLTYTGKTLATRSLKRGMIIRLPYAIRVRVVFILFPSEGLFHILDFDFTPRSTSESSFSLLERIITRHPHGIGRTYAHC
ncbi:hypothetical protein CVT25_009231 [Psilocybe cyanescens]|uniref:Uncharacterized protein n=1 Tax=Psilocybe cyanescens TaxID=93625 RepID=A0A409WW60_PSICY|nr:hypothetical protein CVT25_009231 [Psilocybe cyanescens]